MRLTDFRRLRGLVGVSAVWALLWVPLGSIVTSVDSLVRGHGLSWSWFTAQAPTLALIGAMCGFLFGVLLASVERGKPFEKLSHVRIATWGLASGIVIPAGYALINGFSSAVVGFIGYGAINTIAAVLTLTVARRAGAITPGAAHGELPRTSV